MTRPRPFPALPVFTVIDELVANQDERNRDVSEMAAMIRQQEAENLAETHGQPRNMITGGMK